MQDLTPKRRAAPLLVAAAAFLALADTGIVALALPPILLELDTTVSGVASVLGVYAVVLAVALPPALAAARRLGPRTAGLAGLGLFGVASLVCGVAESLPLLLVARGAQAVGGALVLVVGFSALVDRERLWTFALLLGTVAGPALGGALTQAFGWRSIFVVQAALAPLLVLGFAGATGAELARTSPQARRFDPRPAAALVLASGALAAALFLAVVLLVNGWSIEPLAAAAVISTLPVGAVLGARRGGRPAAAAVGALALAAGTACLAFLPDASVAWMIVPLALAGMGMGLALSGLVGVLLPERDESEASRLLVLRHAGIALALVVLAPVLTDELDSGVEDAKLRGAALILDARLPPQDKFDLAPDLAGAVQSDDPRDDLRRSFAEHRGDIDDEDLGAYGELRERADETLVRQVNEGFAPAFLIGAGFALLAGLLLWRLLPLPRAVAAIVAAVLIPGAFALAAGPSRPDAVKLADPCEERDLPSTGGPFGFVQDAALVALDRAACDAGSSREELALALLDNDERERYKERYDLDPSSVLDLIRAALDAG